MIDPRVLKAIRMKEAIQKCWGGVEKAMGIPKENKVQREECMKTFVYGYYACFDLLMKINASDMNEKEATMLMTNIKKEAEKLIREFGQLNELIPGEPMPNDGTDL